MFDDLGANVPFVATDLEIGSRRELGEAKGGSGTVAVDPYRHRSQEGQQGQDCERYEGPPQCASHERDDNAAFAMWSGHALFSADSAGVPVERRGVPRPWAGGPCHAFP